MAALRGGMLIAGEAQLGRQHHGFFSAVMGVVGHAIAQLKFQLHLSVRTFEAERLCGDIQPQSRLQEKEGKKAFSCYYGFAFSKLSVYLNCKNSENVLALTSVCEIWKFFLSLRRKNKGLYAH